MPLDGLEDSLSSTGPSMLPLQLAKSDAPLRVLCLGAHSDDIEMLEIVMPADYATVEVPSV